MTTKERIVQFVDYKGFSKRKFCDSVGMSHTIFNTNSALGSDKLELIFNTYPELNMDWVITGRGEMINVEQPEPKEKDWKLEYEKLNFKYMDLLEKYSESLEKKDLLKQTPPVPKSVRNP